MSASIGVTVYVDGEDGEYDCWEWGWDKASIPREGELIRLSDGDWAEIYEVQWDMRKVEEYGNDIARPLVYLLVERCDDESTEKPTVDWKSPDEELPEDNQKVVVTDGKGIDMAYFFDGQTNPSSIFSTGRPNGMASHEVVAWALVEELLPDIEEEEDGDDELKE